MKKQISNFQSFAKKIRSSLNLTQHEMADTLGVEFYTVYRYESGIRKPNKEILDKYIELYFKNLV